MPNTGVEAVGPLPISANAVNCVRGAMGGTLGGCALEDVEIVHGRFRFLIFAVGILRAAAYWC